MKTFESITETLSDLQRRGFVYDFNLQTDRLQCDDIDISLQPAEFEVVEVYHFEDKRQDEATVYAIESKDGLRGILIDGYGLCDEPLNREMNHKLHQLNLN